jgi:hypothetical protein
MLTDLINPEIIEQKINTEIQNRLTDLNDTDLLKVQKQNQDYQISKGKLFLERELRIIKSEENITKKLLEFGYELNHQIHFIEDNYPQNTKEQKPKEIL